VNAATRHRAVASTEVTGANPNLLSAADRIRALAVAFCAAICLSLLLAAPGAQAEVSYQPSGDFVAGDAEGILPLGIAVSPASGDVYAAMYSDEGFTGNGVLRRFSSAGAAEESTPVGGLPHSAALDPASGNVYVFAQVSGNDFAVATYTADGDPVGTPFAAPSSGAQTIGIAADASGNVYVPDNVGNEVKIYTPAGVLLDSIAPTGANAFSGPAIAAVDSQGNVYVVDGTTAASVEDGRLQKFDSDGDFVEVVDQGEVASVAVDTATDNVFVGKGSGFGFHILALDSSGAEFDDFGLGEFADALAGFFTPRIAVNPSNGRVYASDPRGLDPDFGQIHFFDPVALPDVTTGSASGIAQTAATLNGTVNPAGVAVTDCHFEYVTEAEFTANGFDNAVEAACVPAPGSGSAAEAVTATIGGLAASTAYRFRLLAANAAGATSGADQQFTTLAPTDTNPPVTTPPSNTPLPPGPPKTTDPAAHQACVIAANQAFASANRKAKKLVKKAQTADDEAVAKKLKKKARAVKKQARAKHTAALAGCAARFL
jgi:DNA-binding beta-propeller fold protein YncE